MTHLESVDTLVIGSGTGGYVAALKSAQLGMKTAVVEREQIGGVCTNVGCIPSKALIAEAHRFKLRKELSCASDASSFEESQAFKQAVVNKQAGGVNYLLKTAGVTVIEGEASLIDGHTAVIKQQDSDHEISFKHVILATGSRPIEIDAVPFGGRILSSTEALGLTQIPESLVVIGGGYIGVELGQMYAKFRTKVTILEGGGQVLPGFEAELTRPVVRQLTAEGVTIITEAKVNQSEQHADGVTIYYSKNEEQQMISADYALVTVGRRPNTDGNLGLEHIGLMTTNRGLIETDDQCRTAIPNIFAIGDIISGPALAHKASYEAKIAAEAIAGKQSALDYKAIPLVVFSEPEIASIGLSETECKAKEIPVTIGRSSFSINGRALALKEVEGFVKIVADQASGIIVGAQIVGPEASTLISEFALAIEMGATLEDVALTIHPHPTLGEVIMEAAENAVNKIKKQQIG
ncbi:dihydrolipoyl dehydrogenase [Paenibacillus glycinis]|uniref:Dihydrolipoyl dehydrogenase n=1 Tax=Paenibacillus glycinis TaxID=2697035 RepID=A0ABW9XKF7_9BACL|nr:dihydrolipoyl dehydrogenase [Paenibacillus glycinis]NBD23092.1 dihydrolipoyl dehydrogenase [Paenibacillus glycinis]